ncbi:MAG: peroxiredoxin [Mycolicibacterium cosmeticum]|nr:peroxiredoxin [Mycolicibacterium cosmeticum]
MMAGDRAPDFTLRDHTGKPQTLSALLSGGPVVLFFFPLASSPICTAQACHFRDLGDEFAKISTQRIGISTDTVDKQAHFAQQRSFDYSLLSDADGVVSELFGVRRGRLSTLRSRARTSGHRRRRGLLARLMPVRRTTFVIDTDRTVLKIIAGELRASMHADDALTFLQNRQAPHTVPEDIRTEPEPVAKPSLVRPYTLTAGRTDSVVELPLDARVEVIDSAATPPRWPKHDVRGQILTLCGHGPSVAEVAAAAALPLGATRFLVGDLVSHGYLRVHDRNASMTVDERRELLSRTLSGLRAL